MADRYQPGLPLPPDQNSAFGLVDLRPTAYRPLVHQGDPALTDQALQRASQYATQVALPLGLGALGGPASMTFRNMFPSLVQSILGPFDNPDPRVLQGAAQSPKPKDTLSGLIRAYHGTTGDFEQFDPALSKDLGIHFGTPEQAQKAVYNVWSKEYPQGANIRPVNFDPGKTVELPDVFSLLGKGMNAVANKLRFESPLNFNDAEREALYSAAKRMDALKRKAGGIRQWMLPEQSTLLSPAEKAEYADLHRKFWDTVQNTIQRNGYDTASYSNKVEGKGKSYIVFDPNRIRSGFEE